MGLLWQGPPSLIGWGPLAVLPLTADWLRGLTFMQPHPSLVIGGEGWGHRKSSLSDNQQQRKEGVATFLAPPLHTGGSPPPRVCCKAHQGASILLLVSLFSSDSVQNCRNRFFMVSTEVAIWVGPYPLPTYWVVQSSVSLEVAVYWLPTSLQECRDSSIYKTELLSGVR